MPALSILPIRRGASVSVERERRQSVGNMNALRPRSPAVGPRPIDVSPSAELGTAPPAGAPSRHSSRPSPGASSYLGGQGRPKRLWRTLVAHGVTVSLVVLVSLSHAGLPDATCIDGIYDDADYDDAVRLVVDGFLTVRARSSPPGPSTMGAGTNQALVLVESAALELVLFAAPVRLAVGIVHGRTTRGPPIATPCLCSPPAQPRSSLRSFFGNG
jgi:hypothetical protein